MNGHYDVVVIGGGIHGVGVAQAAAAGGYSVLLLERTELAAGTSSRSSKLIHGGLRYLETAQLHLVRESLREREILLRIAPDLVRFTPFHIPVYRQTTRPPWMIRAGLSLYAVLGGLSRHMRFTTLARGSWDDLDGLETRDLLAVFRYYDAQTDDAELTRAVMRSAQSLGTTLKCPAEFLSAQREADGYAVRYSSAGDEAGCHATALVNAAGPWANLVLERIAPTPGAVPIDLVQGTHIALDGTIERGIYYVEAPRDRRAVFVMPWHGATLIGTTETPYRGDPAAVRARPEEVEYLADTFHRYFPQRRVSVREAFAGLRVLPAGAASPFRRPRETILHPDDAARPRLLTVYGGKLTGYRATAGKVMRLLRNVLPPRSPFADTATLPLTPSRS